MKRISNLVSLCEESMSGIVGGTGFGECSCSSQCTCVCKNSEPKAGTARENHKWESRAVLSRTQLQNL